jgi:GNAT superfamily N-acetyltransferase
MQQEGQPTLIVSEYVADQLDSIVSVLADAFVTNPLLIAAFGEQRLDQSQRFFKISLEHMFKGTSFVALVDGAVGGYMHFAASPSCLPPPDQVEVAVGTLFKSFGEAAPRLGEWFSTWCRLDPKEPHIHLGPIGVSPAFQSQRVGTALMNRYIAHLEREGAAGYLETDRTRNVEFYRKFGFSVRHEQTLLGMPTWYMWRPKQKNSAG